MKKKPNKTKGKIFEEVRKFFVQKTRALEYMNKTFIVSILTFLSIRMVAQAPPCTVFFNSAPASSICIGTTATINALAGGANLGNGTSGGLTISSTVFTDGTLSAVSGANGVIGSNSIAVTSASGFNVGDEVLIITMQDAATTGNRAGIYEFKTITSVSSNNLIFSQALANTYTASGTIKHQVIKVQNYTNITINSGGVLTCSAWNGTTGGVLCFRANGNVIVNSGGSIHANGKGYRGVAQRAAICRMTDGGQGEGIYGTGIASGACYGSAGNNSGAWLAANGNGGGGGTGTGDSGGGGGGAYASAGTSGVNGGHSPGLGGTSVGNSSLTLLLMGGAGGEGGGDEDGGAPGAGGNGGGIVYFTANTFSLVGTVSSNGNNGNNSIGASGCGMAGGGGGAGGSLQIGLINFVGSGSNITVNKGIGGAHNGCGGYGGDGSLGRIRVDYTGTVPVTTPPAYQGSGVITSGVSYTWSTGSSSSSISVNPSVTTIYNVTVSALPSCTAATNSLSLLVVQLPIVTANSGSLCTGQSFTLNGSGAQTYSWTGSGLNFNPPSGGVITYSNGYRIHTFTNSGVFVAPSNLTVSALLVAGGGGGGSDMGGGGGGGGVIYMSSSAVNSGSLNIVVGAGGTGAIAGVSQNAGANGGNSTFNGTTAIGGGGGGSEYGQSSVVPYAAKSGGSGGGAPGSSNPTAGTGTSGQGFNGGGGGGNYYPGGGGGAGGTGSVNPGTGGPGIQYPAISPLFWAGGGGGSGYSVLGGNGGIGGGGGGAVGVTTGGAGYNSGSAGGGGVINAQTNMPGGNAGANTGGGGGGGSHYNSNNYGGNGGSGIVIIKYLYVNNTVAITPTTSTEYTLTGTSAAGCISNPVTTTISVGPYPTLAVNSGSICSGQSFTIAPTGGATYTIQGGSAIVSPTVNSTYSITGTSSLGCTSPLVLTSSVSIVVAPVLSISSATTTICSGDLIGLSANGANTYTWSTGSNLNSISESPSINTTYSLTGTNLVGCSGNTATLAVTVNTLPVVSITGTNAICAGDFVNLTANGANTYTWSTSSNANSISVSPSVFTTYSLSGSSAAGCLGSNTATIDITVNALPVVSITGTNALCAGDMINLTANGASTYTWSNASNASSIAVSPASNTTYSLTGTSLAGCLGNMTATLDVTVNALPIVSITGTNALCAGDLVNLTANGASTYTWSTASNSTSITVSPAVYTTYSLNGTSAAGCLGSNTATFDVTVNALPLVSISGTTALCAGDLITLTASGADTYTWDTGSNSNTISVSPSVNTTYSVSGSSLAGCVGNTATLAVTVNTLPVVVITGTNALCAGDLISLSANGASTYTWSIASNAATISVSPTTNTTYSLNGSSSVGCFGNTATLAVTVNTLPIVAITGTNALCAGDLISLSANGANTYTWSTASNANNINVSPITTTTYSLTGTSAVGCLGANTATLAVTVNTLPVVAISGTNALCAGASVNLTAGGATSYTWSNASNANSIAVSPVSTTTYSLTGSSLAGCIGNTATLAVTVNTLPLVAITGTNALCAGASVTLTAGGATTYTWSNGSNANSIAVSPASTTTYSLNGTSAFGCLGTTALLAVTVNSLPIVSITGTTALCAGSSVNLTAAGANTYTWNTSSNANNITVSPASTTTYSLTGQSPVGCSGNTATLALTVNPNPTLTITGATGICTGQNASLTASGANSYSWSTGSTNASIVTTPTVNTTYSITGSSVFGCTTNTIQLVTVQASLSISITGPSSVCYGKTANLIGLGGVTYTWNTGATSSTIAPSLTTTTTYSVMGASGTCSNSALYTVSVNPNPTVSITGSTSICSGNTASLNANGASTYSWTSGANTQAVTLSPLTTTNYSVTGSYSTGCSDTQSTTITVYSLPVISISGNAFICSGDTTILSAAGANTYSWSNAANTTSISINPNVNQTYTATGINLNGCSSSNVITVTVNALPTLSLSGNTAICAGDSQTLNISGANTYSWNNGSTANSIVVTPSITAGNFTFSVIGFSSVGCKNSQVDSILINAIPSLSITGGNYVCNGNTLTLNVSGASTYSWNTGSLSYSIAVTPSVNTSYSVTGTSTAGCNGIAVNNVTVVTFPTLSITGNTVMCYGDSLTLVANGANTYTWSTGSTSSVVVVKPGASTSYSLVGEIGLGCSDTTQTNITVNSLPSLSLTVSSNTICLGEKATLLITGAVNYAWSTNETLNSISVSPSVTTSYSVIGTDQNNCRSKDSVILVVSKCTAISEQAAIANSTRVYPNPNHGSFVIEMPESTDAEINISNMLGQKLLTIKAKSINNIDLLNFDNGIYFIHVTQNNNIVYRNSIIKE